MRFPSISALAARAWAVLLRFPWVLAAGLVAATAGIMAVEREANDAWVRLAMVSALGLPLGVALTLFAERWAWSGWKKTTLLALGALCLAGFFQVWAGVESKHDAIRYFQLSAGIHLLVAFLPFAAVAERRGFWEYNRRLFEGFLSAAVFSLVLYLGLMIALVALKQLFGIDIPDQNYLRLWFVIAFIVDPWIFLGFAPESLPDLEAERDYPRALKVFTQYILTPLVAVYLVILIAYLFKVLATGEWPRGWIGYLVASVAVTGILGFLLVHPLRTREDEGWIRTYSRWLYVGLIPAAIMFLLALWKRVDPYGLTELRFLGLVMGAWLLGVAILYTVKRDFGIRIIPVSLAALLLLTLYGPVSATSLSVRSQVRRLHGLLQSNGLTGAATISERPGVSREDLREISGTLRYLLEHRAAAGLQSAFGRPLPELDSPMELDRDVESTAARIMERMHLAYLPAWAGATEAEDVVTFRAAPDSSATRISGYDYAVRVDQQSPVAYAGGDTLTLAGDSLAGSLALLRGDDTLMVVRLAPLVDSLLALAPVQRFQIEGPRMRIEATGPGARGLLLLRSVTGGRMEGVMRVRAWSGELYFALNGEQ
ncbi:MAG: DUF4153 domain-containing protein [Gemmatimonadales bacterium]